RSLSGSGIGRRLRTSAASACRRTVSGRGAVAGLLDLDGVDELALAHPRRSGDAQAGRELLELRKQHRGQAGAAAATRCGDRGCCALGVVAVVHSEGPSLDRAPRPVARTSVLPGPDERAVRTCPKRREARTSPW